MTTQAQTFSTAAPAAPQAPAHQEPEVTQEQVDRHYAALHDSVNLINSLVTEKPSYMSEEDRKDTIKRNEEHLKYMRAKTFWGERDMTEVDTCIVQADAFLKA